MANNRMFIKCSICGEEMSLAKTMGHGYYVPFYSKLVSNLDVFLTAHRHEDKVKYSTRGMHNEHFVISYETVS